MRGLDTVVVMPYGVATAAYHFAFKGDYLSFCGRNIEEWTTADMTFAQAFDSSYCCKKCRNAILK